MSRLLTSACLIALAILGGCSRGLMVEYGATEGSSSVESINGFGAIVQAYRDRDFATRQIYRLNDRVIPVDAILWIPQGMSPIDPLTSQWLDTWLSAGNKTLVYVTPDDGCEFNYFMAARPFASASQKLEYRRRIARLRTDAFLSRSQAIPVLSSGWFHLEPVGEFVRPEDASGEWIDWEQEVRPTKSTEEIFIQFGIVPAEKFGASPISLAVTSTTTSGPKDLQTRDLVVTPRGTVMVREIRSSVHWGNSKIITISGGSQLCNFALTRKLNANIASRLIDETAVLPATVAFLSTSGIGPVVNESTNPMASQSGMEWLTVWPINLVMVHLLAIGFLCCLVLFPIFGRPREAARVADNSFREHLDAVASLMHRSGGAKYAKQRVSDYMTRIRGESSGEWVRQDDP